MMYGLNGFVFSLSFAQALCAFSSFPQSAQTWGKPTLSGWCSCLVILAPALPILDSFSGIASELVAT